MIVTFWPCLTSLEPTLVPWDLLPAKLQPQYRHRMNGCRLCPSVASWCHPKETMTRKCDCTALHWLQIHLMKENGFCPGLLNRQLCFLLLKWLLCLTQSASLGQTDMQVKKLRLQAYSCWASDLDCPSYFQLSTCCSPSHSQTGNCNWCWNNIKSLRDLLRICESPAATEELFVSWLLTQSLWPNIERQLSPSMKAFGSQPVLICTWLPVCQTTLESVMDGLEQDSWRRCYCLPQVEWC